MARTVSKLGFEFEVVDTACGFDFWTWFESGTWEPDTFEVLTEFLHPGVTFLDVGAWIGPISLVASRMCDRVVAVEPDPVAHEELYANLALNQIHNVDVYEMAVGVTDFVDLGRDAEGRFGDSMTSVLYTVDSFTVPAEPLEAFVPDNCGLIKVDIEGAERWVLDDFDLPCPMWLSTHPMLPGKASGVDRFVGRNRVVRTSGHDLLLVPR